MLSTLRLVHSPTRTHVRKDDVHMSPLLQRLIKQGRNLFLVRDVSSEGDVFHFSTRSNRRRDIDTQAGSVGFTRGLGKVADDNSSCAFFGETQDGRCPDSTCCAGNDADFVEHARTIAVPTWRCDEVGGGGSSGGGGVGGHGRC